MSYFEPSRPRFQRRRIGSPSGVFDWIAQQPRWRRAVGFAGLALYVGGATALCGAAPTPSAVTGIATALLFAVLHDFYLRRWPVVSALCFGLLVALGALALLLPAIVFTVLGFWLLISLPLWLYRA